ncbi:MAG: hypothetical protein ACO1SX_20760 [Actinomycetota bacterium]
MIVLEVLLTAALIIGALAAIFLRLTRPLWSAARRRLRIEAEAQRMVAERLSEQRELRSEALLEVRQFLEKGGAGKLISPELGGLGASIDPVLRAVLEKHPLDERVVELARVYRQATGKELLPERLRKAMQEPGERPKTARKLTAEEERLLAEARREVDGWAGSERSQG